MAITVYQSNLAPSLSDTIKVNGAAFDLTGSTVRFRMRPEGSSTLTVDAAATVVSATAGTVRYDWQTSDVATAGSYLGWWSATLASGKQQDTSEFAIAIVAHAEAGSADLCAVADIRAFLEIDSTDTSRDLLIAQLITAASAALSKECEREFAPVSTGLSRSFRWDMSQIIELAPYDLRNITSVVLSPEITSPQTLAAGTDYLGTPIGQLPDGVFTSLRLSGLLITRTSPTLFRFGFMEVQITGDWGFPTIPAQVAQACVETVASWLRRDVASYGFHPADMDPSGIAPKPVGSFSIPYSARAKIAPFRRNPGIY